MNNVALGFLVVALAGCGSVTAASEPQGDGGAAGLIMGAGGGGGTAAASVVGGAGGGGSAGAAAAAGGGAGCGAPTLAVSWTIADLETLAPMTCEQAGIINVRVTFTSLPGEKFDPITVVLPCAPGAGVITNMPMQHDFVYAVAPEGNFSDARAAWSRKSVEVGTIDGSKCGSAATAPAKAQLIVGAPPSCDPCVNADRCAGSATTHTNTCEAHYGDDRANAILACQQFLADHACK